LTERKAALRAPARDGSVVAEPPLAEAGAVLARNRRHWQTSLADRVLFSRTWVHLRQQARRSTIAAALRYLGEYGQTADREGRALEPETLLVAGHQPELFHPGVWVKNFALQGLAHRHGAAALNLVVDNDTVKTTAVWVPTPPPQPGQRPQLRLVPFDRWTGESPYEERTIADQELFAGFAARAGELLRGWDYEPILPAFWAEVLRQARRTPLLGECFAAARRTFEQSWGCYNLEVPIHVVCRTEPFAWFACHLLTELRRFHHLYNTTVHEYRQRNGIRSRNHPVPDLARDVQWLEAPFWGWRTGSTARRGRLFVRLDDNHLDLRVDAEAWPSLPISDNGEDTVQAWQQLGTQGFKVRSRALTTTLYARLFLADLFLHGIGGGKYDELTDELIRGFYQVEPPAYLVLSATRWLPLPRAAVDPQDRRRLLRAVRDVHFNPQRHLGEADPLGEDVAKWTAEKEAWIASQPQTARQRRERFRRLRSLTEQLRQPLRQREEQLRQELELCQRQLAANAVLQRRDYSFCLFPEAVLQPFCTQFLHLRDT
jgi:hypothetical protein